ncbi:flagellar biosynthesis protein [Novosphingobium sp. PC22D]|uniref:EscU/YscU/HrcU family type III secretion system export apparatus switch protein n=1 Tax=Novosphingobium sp. PC22D TaxID=1962403 RepID=UPI000BF14737|nr:flagellar type III secretion system protein FlhB [Novosphingobium sp. PC22D]PEQ14294.1 flagellar biosynthesis protein [Novosphingobium sp. PC22D]
MSETSGEKTHAPTPKRKQDAAKKGDVLRSRELATAGATLVGATWLLIAGPWLFTLLRESLRSAFSFDRGVVESFQPGDMLVAALLVVLPPVAVLGFAVIGVSLVSQLGFGDGRWVGGNLAFKGNRMNPASGLKRMFGPNGWIEMGKGLLKVTLLGTIATVWASIQVPQMVKLGRGDLAGQLAAGWDAVIVLFFALSAGLFLIAFVDLPVQWIRRLGRLKMSHQELRDEHKDSEGSPEKKAAVRERQRKIAMGGLVPAMQEAQFVITNPTHFSVALAYDPAKAPAPIVVAKGRGEKALAMRELAREYALPTLEYPALARSVFYTTREKQMIREELYVAVASILAFVLALKRGETPAAPQVQVPVTLRFDADGQIETGA